MFGSAANSSKTALLVKAESRRLGRAFELASGLRSEYYNPPRSVLAGPHDKFVQRRTRKATAFVSYLRPALGRGDVCGFGKRREDRATPTPTVGAVLECTSRCVPTPCREATRFRLLLGLFVRSFSIFRALRFTAIAVGVCGGGWETFVDHPVPWLDLQDTVIFTKSPKTQKTRISGLAFHPPGTFVSTCW